MVNLNPPLPIGFGAGAIYADPAWRFEHYSQKGEAKSANAQYKTMTVEELKAMPVMFCAGRNCALFMWATFPMLPEALEVMAAWGFKYKAGFSWHKRTKNGKLNWGPGYIVRGNAELLLIGTTGEPTWKAKNVLNALEFMIRGHSRKPDEIYPIIERMVDGPYLELFARQSAPGWTPWGNEVDKFQFGA